MMYLKNYNLKNKTAVVTGAGKGLGRACAIALAEAGANLIIIILLTIIFAFHEDLPINIRNSFIFKIPIIIFCDKVFDRK